MDGSNVSRTGSVVGFRQPLASGARARTFRVVVVEGPDEGASSLVTERTLVGTSPEAGLRLGDGAVSRIHAELVPHPEGLAVRDLGSRNGTFAGKLRITDAVLADADTLRVGHTLLVLREATPDLTGAATLGLLGTSLAVRTLRTQVTRLAASEATVLISGETGTGKERVASLLHQGSPRAKHPFVVLDCAAISPQLMESELFGHVRGAFTGAVESREGAFQTADGGTLFLDEVGELPLELQVKLLRVVESGVVRRVGETRERRVDVRILAATHRELEKEAQAGRFREDLFFRLAVVVLRLPPLRERLEDLDALVEDFLRQQGRPAVVLPARLMQRLRAHTWPGNVRELRNVVDRALAGVDPAALLQKEASALHAPDDLKLLPFHDAKDALVDMFTRDYLAALFERCGGNVSEMARASGINRTYLHRLLGRHGVTGR